jgi:hypothetical protein
LWLARAGRISMGEAMIQPRYRLAIALGAAALCGMPLPARAQGPAIPDQETMDPPTRARLAAIEGAAAATGWEGVVVPLRAAAMRAYAHDRLAAADQWYHLYRWAFLFAEPENQFVGGWVEAIMSSHLNYEGVAGEFHPTDRPLGLGLSPGLQDWMLSNDGFSEEFFSNVRPVDQLQHSFAILQELHDKDPEKFAKYSSLALAIALVYDTPPPPWWPHYQVSAKSLPRKLPKPADTFDRLTSEDAQGRTYFRLARLRTEELKFVVDTAAPASELDWSEGAVPYHLDDFDQTYQMVKYRQDRMSSGQMVWPETPYTLQAIKAEGGICVDEAYFASEAGKARGIPTLLFTGDGRDGRHAWFGYLDGQHKWRLDAGRFAEQRFVTGNAIDPQTWDTLSDHELQFLSERFRALPTFMQSRVREEFAEDFMHGGDARSAARAARSAVNIERRNLDGWETLISAETALGVPAAEREGVLREAARAFTPNYPDLVRSFVNRVGRSLRARGETSLAEFEERGLAQRLMGDRSDLAVTQAATILSRSIATQSIPDQIATYNAILAQFGHGAGTIFFDEIVTGFAEHLASVHMKGEARAAVDRAREVLEVQPGTQFASDVDKLMTTLQD